MKPRKQNNSTTGKRSISILDSLDWPIVVIYLLLLALGWMSVCGASYDFDLGPNFLDLSSRSGMQLVWIGTSLILASVILLTDERVIESFSYVIYIGFLALLFVTPFLAHDIKGSLSWIKIGPFSLQPAEFAKFGVALCVAKVMSIHGFTLSTWRNLMACMLLILTPMALIVLQKETGSALVYASFFLMLYREGMPGCFLFAGVSAVTFFVVGVRYADTPLFGSELASVGPVIVLWLIHFIAVCMLFVYTASRTIAWRLLLGGFLFSALSLLCHIYVVPFDVAWAMLLLCIVTIGYLLYYAMRERLLSYLYIALFALGSVAFHYSADYVLDNVMQLHQQARIRVLLGLEDDPRGAGYNVIQAQIAIGSGGLQGKGFLNGTQTKLKYVPEQDTDFIFCTVGEEEGFLGCAVVLSLFLALILRLIHLAERQPYAFGRVYGYCVLSVFLFHVFINVGMVLGLTPVIGIPLPFFSYGGSSLWGFTILLFIFLRIDMGRKRLQR